MSTGYAIGIDLGTTYSCVGVFKDGRVEIFANEAGDRTTPSVVAYTGSERLVGPSAVNQMNSNPENTVYGIKRVIGRDFDKPEVQADIANWPFKVVRADNKRSCQVVVNYQGEEKKFYPEEISAVVLGLMKSTAEAGLGVTVKDAVVTVPAYFDNQQRESTKDAGRIADLNILRTINEPTAAAMAYGLHKTKEQVVAVYDLGGGTFDVSVMTLEDGLFQVLASDGDCHLGGEDFDNLMVNYCVAEFLKKTGVNVSKMSKPIRRLKTACERQKRALSSSSSVQIDVESIHDGVDLRVNMTRAKFDSLCSDLFKKTLECMTRCLQRAKKDKSEVDQVVLVGGSTRILKIQQMLSEYFCGKELNKSVNPDEAVAYGAAVQAAILGPNKSEEVSHVLLLDVIPVGLGVMVHDKTTVFIINACAAIPTKKSETFTTYANDQTSVQIEIYSGNRLMAADNHKIGTFSLEGIPPAPRGVPQIEVTFDVDAGGSLHVTARDKASGKENVIVVKDSGGLSPEAIKKMKEDAEKFSEQDRKLKSYFDELNQLEGLVTSVRTSLDNKEMVAKLVPSEVESVKKLAEEVESWLNAESRSLSPEVGSPQCQSKKKQVEDMWYPMYQKLSSGGDGGQPGGPFPPPPHGGMGGMGGPRGAAPGGSAGPTIEEVD